MRQRIDQLDEETLRKRRKKVNALSCIIRVGLRMAWENGKTNNDRSWRSVKSFRTVARPRALYLSRPECKRLVTKCSADLRPFVLAALYTGCRGSELLRMRVMDVARDGYGVYVRPGKQLKSRFIFLPDEGMAFFLSLTKERGNNDLLFTGKDGKSSLRPDYRYRFKVAVQDADLPDGFSFHGLRHTYASQLVAAGASLIAIAEQLGHSNIKMVSEVYGHLAPQIRESEVRQRFSSVSVGNAKLAAKQEKQLTKLRKSLYGDNWRAYAVIDESHLRNDTRTVAHR